jgi:sulfate permease, SulP family
MLGLIIGMDGVHSAVAIAALVFTGHIASGVGLGVGTVLLSGAISALVYAWWSRLPNAIRLVQESNIALLTPAIAGMVAASQVSVDATIATTLAIIAIASIASGGVQMLTGWLKLGGLSKYLPYPVLAGFLAGAGWLMVDGANIMITGMPVISNVINPSSEPLPLLLMGCTIAYALLLMAASQWTRNPAQAVPLAMLLAIGMFFFVISITGISIDTVRALGHLPEITEAGHVSLPSPSVVGAVEWQEVLKVTPSILLVAVLSTIHLMLIISSFDLATGRDSDISADLKANGLANLASGLVGGPIGYTGMAVSVLASETSASRRVTAISAAIVMLGVLAAADQILRYLPVFLPAGFILFLGFSLLKNWFFRPLRLLPLLDCVVIGLIVISIALVGFLEGILIGLTLSMLFFVVNFARLPVVRLRTNGSERNSTVDWSSACKRFLAENGQQIELIILQGYLFFGTADSVASIVRGRIANDSQPSLRYLILDFRHITSADSTAISSLIKIHRIAAAAGATLLISQLPENMKRTFRLIMGATSYESVQFLSSADAALALAEEGLLYEHESLGQEKTLESYLSAYIDEHPRIPGLIQVMSREVVPPETMLIHHGDATHDLFFLVKGRVRVQIIHTDGTFQRLRSMMEGAIFGEIAFCLRQTGTADVVSETTAIIYRLRLETFEELQNTDPELASLIYQIMAKALAQKLAIASKALKSLDS